MATTNIPLQIAFHNMPPSETAESRIRELAESLSAHYDRIQSCRVIVDVPHRHHKEGNSHSVRIDLKVPHGELVVKLDASTQAAPRDLDSVLLDAFEDARRQLDDHVEKLRGHVKIHNNHNHARVTKLFPDRGFGFLETTEGREIYFHRNSVLNEGYSRLKIGSEVTYAEELGEKGPQASTVRLVGRHNHHP